MKKDWYSPGEIRWTVHQVLWVIRNLGSIQLGHWPQEASNYIDTQSIMGGRYKTTFETAIDVSAEITDRLEKCGPDGLILLAIECWGLSDDSLAKYFSMPIWSIRKRRKLALGYVASGPARRWLDTKKRKAESYKDYRQRKK